MSFNIGTDMSKYVAVSNVTMKFAFSEKVLFADLRTSRKTNEPKKDPETGKDVIGKDGNPVFKRIYSHWDGRFVGNALEPAKGLTNGQLIDIVNGWIEKEEVTTKSGKHFTNVIVVISDFVLSDVAHAENVTEDDEATNGEPVYRAMNGDTV